MTTEHRLVFEPADIRAARVTCATCAVVVSLPIIGGGNLPRVCPGCGVGWADRYGAWEQIQTAIDAIKVLGDRERHVDGSTKAFMSLAFEIDAKAT
jgi:hypothetical protein